MNLSMIALTSTTITSCMYYDPKGLGTVLESRQSKGPDTVLECLKGWTPQSKEKHTNTVVCKWILIRF